MAVGFPGWTGDEPISRHPSGVPILDGFAAHDAFKAADLASVCNVLAAVVNRAAFTGSMTRFGHGSQNALRPVRFPVNNPAIIKPTTTRRPIGAGAGLAWGEREQRPALLPPHTIGIIPASTKVWDASRRGGNGEQQIEVACRGADTRQDARVASAPYPSAQFVGASIVRISSKKRTRDQCPAPFALCCSRTCVSASGLFRRLAA